MKGYVANTDYEWYRYLLGRPDPHHGARITLPDDPAARPDPALLTWHNSERFLE
jgi:hypothetical protein